MAARSTINFDISKVQLSRVYSFIAGNKGEYLAADWLGRPTYWRKDEEDGHILYTGRLDERAQRLYRDFLEEEQNHKYRADYITAAVYLESDYRKFEAELSASNWKFACWKIQSTLYWFFSWMFGLSFKSLEHINPHQPPRHSKFYHEAATCEIEDTEIRESFDPPLQLVLNPHVVIHSVPREPSRKAVIEFDPKVWAWHQQSPENQTILESLKSFSAENRIPL